jgi:hypothetical protein
VTNRTGFDRRAVLWLALAVGAAVALSFAPPMAQDPAYHRFADDRSWLGVPSFTNVVSNLPFLVLGLVGMARTAHGPRPGGHPRLRPAYLVFFAGAALVGIGSSYYHWAPSNATLAWDRATMTIAFMAFCAVVVGEQVGAELGRRLLAPLLAAGLGSIVWWRLGDAAGAGDLRPYVLVQFLPLLILPLLLLCYRPAYLPSSYLWAVFACYAIAKVLELADAPLLAATGMGGHAWKHLAAAAGVLFVLLALERRRPRGAEDSDAIRQR